MSTDKIPDGGFICAPCADSLGGKWPPGHEATCHYGKCCVCGELANVANVGDYDWEDGVPRGFRD